MRRVPTGHSGRAGAPRSSDCGAGDGRLYRIGMGDRHDRLARVAAAKFADRVSHSGVHAGKTFPTRETEAAGVTLDGPPLGQLLQGLQLRAGPLAEVTFEQPSF